MIGEYHERTLLLCFVCSNLRSPDRTDNWRGFGPCILVFCKKHPFQRVRSSRRHIHGMEPLGVRHKKSRYERSYCRVCRHHRHCLCFHNRVHHWKTYTGSITTISNLPVCSITDNTLVERHTVCVACSIGGWNRTKVQTITN